MVKDSIAYMQLSELFVQNILLSMDSLQAT